MNFYETYWAQRGKWISYNDHPETYWVLSYNAVPYIRNLYEAYHFCLYSKGVPADKANGSDGRTELLILSPDIEERFQPKRNN